MRRKALVLLPLAGLLAVAGAAVGAQWEANDQPARQATTSPPPGQGPYAPTGGYAQPLGSGFGVGYDPGTTQVIPPELRLTQAPYGFSAGYAALFPQELRLTQPGYQSWATSIIPPDLRLTQAPYAHPTTGAYPGGFDGTTTTMYRTGGLYGGYGSIYGYGPYGSTLGWGGFPGTSLGWMGMPGTGLGYMGIPGTSLGWAYGL